MTVLHIERNEQGNAYSISCDKGVSISEICYGISAMIKCFRKENLIDDPIIIYNMIQKYTEDTSADLNENTDTNSNENEEVNNDNNTPVN